MKRTSFPYIPQMIAPATAARTIHIKKIPGATPRRCSSGPIPEGSVIWQIFCYPLRASIGSGIAAVFKGCRMPTKSTKSREVGILRGQDRSRGRAGQNGRPRSGASRGPAWSMHPGGMVSPSRSQERLPKTAALLYRAARRYRPPGAVAVLSLISGPAAGWGGAVLLRLAFQNSSLLDHAREVRDRLVDDRRRGLSRLPDLRPAGQIKVTDRSPWRTNERHRRVHAG